MQCYLNLECLFDVIPEMKHTTVALFGFIPFCAVNSRPVRRTELSIQKFVHVQFHEFLLSVQDGSGKTIRQSRFPLILMTELS